MAPHGVLCYARYVGSCPLLICSYDLAIRDEAIKILSAAPLGLLVCDEGHRLKNPACKTYQRLVRLSVKRRLVLTGTPMQVSSASQTRNAPVTCQED